MMNYGSKGGKMPTKKAMPKSKAGAKMAGGKTCDKKTTARRK